MKTVRYSTSWKDFTVDIMTKHYSGILKSEAQTNCHGPVYHIVICPLRMLFKYQIMRLIIFQQFPFYHSSRDMAHIVIHSCVKSSLLI